MCDYVIGLRDREFGNEKGQGGLDVAYTGA